MYATRVRNVKYYIRMCVCVCVCNNNVLHYVIEIDPLDVLSVCVVYTEVIQNVDGLLLLPIDR